jgi:hypothetical protein
MRFLFSVLTLSLLVIGIARAETLSPQTFTEAAAVEARAAMPSARVTVKGSLHLETRSAASPPICTMLMSGIAARRKAATRSSADISAF